MELDVNGIRRDFPILGTVQDGKPLVYLDSAATSQKPKKVIAAISRYYRKYNANIHRGVYKISIEASEAYEKSKTKVAKFINAGSMEEIIYTRNATESINLVALSWAEQNIRSGDHILLSELEHHSNIVPWQILAKRKGAVIDYIRLDSDMAELDAASVDRELKKNPKIVAITQASNVLGTIVDVKSIAKEAHARGAAVLVDAAQSVPHMPVDVRDIDCDFMAFSGHKMLGPTGIGVLYAKKRILEETSPALGGGDMIKTVGFETFVSNDLPWKFEAGTPNIEGGIALGVAVDYLKRIGMQNIRDHEKRLTKYALGQLAKQSGVSVFGPDADDIDHRCGVISFEIDGVHPHDVASIFDQEGIAIRAGHHCAMPLVVNVLKRPALSRMSFYLYNKQSDVDAAISAIGQVKRIFKIKEAAQAKV
jgi:cysteine desulfurase/selenocysteine lyase